MSAAISPEHVEFLERAAIDVAVAEMAGVRTITSRDQLPDGLAWCRNVPGLLFPWRSVDGTTVPQYRPDQPVESDDGTTMKYLFPRDSSTVIGIHPTMVERLGAAKRLLVVEGTKQALAAVSSAPDDVVVAAIAGCWGWSRDGVPLPDLNRLVPVGGEVVVIFDADLTTNPNVHDAASRLSETLAIAGAETVRWVQVPAGGSAGLDDFLATQQDRRGALSRLIDRAGTLPARPKAKRTRHSMFDDSGLRVEDLHRAVMDREHLAVNLAGQLLVYRDGVYVPDAHQITAIVTEFLGDRWRPMHSRAFEEFTVARLVAAGRTLPERQDSPVVNVLDGLLDPLTGELRPHTPEHVSVVQFPVMWDPAATCPTFDQWLYEVVADGLADDLMEATSLVLETRPGRQRKAVFLHGPTRSGKSTFVRLIECLVGPSNRSAVSLHDLSVDRFAAADLYGKVLNAAADLSGAHVEDLSLFKKLTGDDVVRGQHKFGHAFNFRSSALFMFSTNMVPTVHEVSRAYLARIRPYLFPHTFEGREDPALEERMLAELPGVLVRLVVAYQRLHARGGYGDTAATRDALDVFARQSDRVRLFLHEATEADPDGWVERARLFEKFEDWARLNRRQSLGRHRFYEAVEVAGHRTTKRGGNRGFIGLSVRHSDDWGDPGGAEGAGLPSLLLTREFSEESEQVPCGGEIAEPAPSAPSDPVAVVELEF